MLILHTIITTAFVTQCVRLVDHVTPVMVTELAKTDFVNATKTGLTMDVGNVSKLAPEHQSVRVMAYANCMVIPPVVCAKRGGMDPNVTYRAPEC